MKTSFELFLESNELDDLLKLRSKITKLDSQEEKVALRILEAWSDQQAVANLLFHPSLIPASSRERFIFRGLEESYNEYFILASVVGCVGLSGAETSDEIRLKIKQRLIDCCRIRFDVIGERASVSLRSFLEKKDLLTLVPLLSSRNETIRRNIIGWIARNWDDKSSASMSEEFKAAGLSWFQRRRASNAVRQLVAENSTIPLGFRTAPLLSYIPNLKETLQ
jgi:hypothetical protein